MRISTTKALSLFSFVSLAAAIPNNPPTSTVTVTVTATAPGSTVTEPASACSSGGVQCCQSTEKADSAEGAALLGLLGIVLQGANVLLGVDCSPITVVGVGSGACSSTAVCCEDNSFGGLVSIGCVPVVL